MDEIVEQAMNAMLRGEDCFPQLMEIVRRAPLGRRYGVVIRHRSRGELLRPRRHLRRSSTCMWQAFFARRLRDQ
jgi:hypothetical protein